MPENITDTEIKLRTDLAELIGSYVPLEKRGPYHYGECPFHRNGLPGNFHVDSGAGRYRCHGCLATGDCFDFLMKECGITRDQARAILLERLEKVGAKLAEGGGVDEKNHKNTFVDLDLILEDLPFKVRHQRAPHGMAKLIVEYPANSPYWRKAVMECISRLLRPKGGENMEQEDTLGVEELEDRISPQIIWSD